MPTTTCVCLPTEEAKETENMLIIETSMEALFEIERSGKMYWHIFMLRFIE